MAWHGTAVIYLFPSQAEIDEERKNRVGHVSRSPAALTVPIIGERQGDYKFDSQ